MKIRLIPSVVLFGVALASTSAQAAITFDFRHVVAGDPVGGPSYATLTIANAGADTVNFTMTNTMDGSVSQGQFLSALWLNVSPFVAGTMTWSSPTITGYQFDHNNINQMGAKFDYQVSFETANNGNRFTAGKVVTWSVTGNGLTEDDFDAVSTGNKNWYGLVHIQAIPECDDSAKVKTGEPVPEPASLLALGIGAVALWRRRRA
jgi:hypothetical protein